MNCQEFAQLAGELAEDRLADAAARKSALAHALSCARCAAVLADKRVLAAGLRAWAERTEHAAAPPPVKQALRAAFDELHAAPPPARVLAFQPRRAFFEFFATPRWALAAALLVLVALSLASWLRQSGVAPPREIAGASPTPTPVAPVPVPPQVNVDGNDKVAGQPPPRPVPRRRVLRVEPAQAPANPLAAQNQFIPLTYGADPKTLQNGLLVRVEVQRATLLAMGLPFDAARAAEKVKADVMMGEDGVAYAIRFVNN